MAEAQLTLTDDEVELRSNRMRTLLSSLISSSTYSLKEAYESQQELFKRLDSVENALRPVLNMPGIPDYRPVEKKILQLKSRLNSIDIRIGILNSRLLVIESNLMKQGK